MSIGHIRTIYQCNVWAQELRDADIACDIINNGEAACDNGPYVSVHDGKDACVLCDADVERIILLLTPPHE